MLRNQVKMKREFLASLDAVADYVGSRPELVDELKRLRQSPDDTQVEIERKASKIRECAREVQDADREYQAVVKGMNKAEQVLTQITNTISLKQAEVAKFNAQIKKVASPSLLAQMADG